MDIAGPSAPESEMDPAGMDRINAESRVDSETSPAPPSRPLENLTAPVAVIDDVTRTDAAIDQSHHTSAVGSVEPHDQSKDEATDEGKDNDQPDTQQEPELSDVQPPPAPVLEPVEGTLKAEASLRISNTPDEDGGGSSQLEGQDPEVPEVQLPLAPVLAPLENDNPPGGSSLLRDEVTGMAEGEAKGKGKQPCIVTNNSLPGPELYDYNTSSEEDEAKGKGKGPASYRPPPPLIYASPHEPVTGSIPGGFLVPNTGGYYHPYSSSSVPWEIDADRPRSKVPIVLKDAVGRVSLIPWRRARTWEGMKMTVDQLFDKVDAPASNLPYHVQNGHYDLHFVGHQSKADGGVQPGAPPGPSTSAAGSSIPHHPQLVIILPEFWEDLIRPGMVVSMSMWPVHLVAPGPPRPNRRLNVIQSAPNMNVPPPPMPFVNIDDLTNPPIRVTRRGKTRMNPGRPLWR